ncbi:MAG: gamma carbonic anhydrase family protein [bacterium]|nr:gamma carbonic anhydrase family protein [bacterium]MCY4194371.1 gamma carbonic anhydrase family protein [bacterium]MCY4273668.1 gamma carbonic anhydrase family protein [bacterium]
MPIYALGDIEPRIHPEAFVHPQAVIIGRVSVGAGATIWPGAVMRGDGAGITVGERTSIQDNAVIHNTDELPTVVGRDVTVGHLAHLEGCTIEDEALVGVSAIVLHEAVVGRGALVGAGAVVTNHMRIPPLALAIGVPAKIRDGHMSEGQNRADAQGYAARGRRYHAEMRLLG